MKNNPLQGKVAIVTGASSGIGKAIAIKFAEEGATVIVASRTIATCQQVVDTISEQGKNAIAIACDVTKENDITSLFQKTKDEFGKIDIVVASAGISGGSINIEDYSLERWNKVLATNLTGVFLTIREAFRYMKEKGGHILVVGSQAGLIAYAQKGAYCASKFGARGLTHALAEEGREYNINVSVIAPGVVDTPILAATNTNVNNPMTPEIVSETALFLVSLTDNAMVRDVWLERRLQD